MDCKLTFINGGNQVTIQIAQSMEIIVMMLTNNNPRTVRSSRGYTSTTIIIVLLTLYQVNGSMYEYYHSMYVLVQKCMRRPHFSNQQVFLGVRLWSNDLFCFFNIPSTNHQSINHHLLHDVRGGSTRRISTVLYYYVFSKRTFPNIKNTKMQS
jgi:hypothetical protein